MSRTHSIFRNLLATITVALLMSVAPKEAHSTATPNFCADDAPTLALFIDVTTSFDKKSQLVLSEGIEKFALNLRGGERVVLMTIEDSFSSSTKIFDGCVPVCAGSGWYDWIFGSCTSGLVRLKRKEMNAAIRSGLVARLSTASNLPQSDIVRTLNESIAVIFPAGQTGTLFIFSDLIENSEYIPGKDFWQEPNEDLIAKIQTNDLIPNLKAVDVRAFGLGRGGDNMRTPLSPEMLSKLKRFWTAFFEMAGVTEDRLTLTPTLP